MKRYLILLLTLILTLASCTKTQVKSEWPTGTTEPPETTEPPAPEPELEYTALNALPERDMDDATIAITTVSVEPFVSGGKYMYDAAIAARNAAVGEKYNATVAFTENDWEKIFDELTLAVAGGTYYSDILALPMSTVGKFARAGLIKDLSNLEGIDPSAEYYVKTDAFTDLGATYAYMCDSITSGYGYCVFFNEHLAAEKGFDFYSMVKDGSWTWGKLLECAKGMNGAGFTYGDAEQFVNAIVASCGLEYTAYVDGVRSADYTGEFADGVMSLASEVYGSGVSAISEDPADLFQRGACFFYVAPLSEAEKFAAMADSYGVLPLPTYEGGTDYKTYMSPDTPVFCIPAGSSATENAPYILEALAAASEAEMEKQYLFHLANFSMHSEESVRCAALIEQTCTYEYVYVFGPQNNPVANCTYWATQQKIMNDAIHTDIYNKYRPQFDEFVN